MPKLESSKKTKLKHRIRQIPFARGYHPPSYKQQLAAIGFKHNEMPLEYSDIESEDKFFTPIPQPKSVDDWLAQYVEDGQSFREYLKENPWFSKRKSKFIRQTFISNGGTLCEKFPEGKIYIAKIGEFSDQDIQFDDLIDYVRRFLCVPVQILDGLEIEKRNNDLIFVEKPAFSPSSRPGARVKKSCIETRYSAKTKHIQIGVDSILTKMRNIIPKDALCLVGLTPYDLYGDESDLFVAGMAAGNRRVAVFSLMRYNPALTFSKEHWFDIKENQIVSLVDKQRLILQRSCKLVVHEICHLLGLPHCVYFRCCMNGSGHLQEDFDQPMMLCPVDLHKLQALIGFHVSERYQRLLEFYKIHHFTEEAAWTERRLKFLQSKESGNGSTK
uniref:Archaemetzincin-2 n=3 Tax=Arion vulgaris TaxID=1028688 RepID=A0A0B7A3L1_9EUPU